MRIICSFILNGKHLAPKEVRDIGSNPVRSIICPSGGMVDAEVSKTSTIGCVGSSPTLGTSGLKLSGKSEPHELSIRNHGPVAQLG